MLYKSFIIIIIIVVVVVVVVICIIKFACACQVWTVIQVAFFIIM